MKTFDIPEILKLVEEHREIVDSGIKDRREEAMHSSGFLDFRETKDLRYYRQGKQLFAVQGPTAVQLLAGEDDDGNIFVPAIVDGTAYAVWPDEGEGGYVHLCYLKKRDRWTTILVAGGWLKTTELELEPEQIANIIADEIMAGENVITKKPAGWV